MSIYIDPTLLECLGCDAGYNSADGYKCFVPLCL